MSIREITRVMLINPPGPLYQRGEDRCQSDVEHSSATSLRAPNDLATMAAVLRQIGVTPKVVDYPAERLSWSHFGSDLALFQPDAVVMSITHATILEDMKAFDIAKRFDQRICTIAKGALFFSCDPEILNSQTFSSMDFALVGESETVINDLISGLKEGISLHEIRNILFKYESHEWTRTPLRPFDNDLDAIPFPARDLIKNELYVRPDTGEPQATIQTARGCPSKCIFCMTPTISGSRVRSRSVSNVVDEIQECVEKFNIRNFFFKADTFTINKKFVIDLCREIINRRLSIQWVANSRVDTIDEERLEWMKRAGCWLVAFGLESGSEESLRKMKKDAGTQDARRAVQLTKKAGLRVYGFYMIGLPWEDRDHVEQTLRFAKQLNCDFSEIHIATPYEGTELYALVKELGLLEDSSVSHNYFSDPAIGSMFLSREEMLAFRNRGIRSLYFSPKYIFNTVSKIRTAQELANYAGYGMRMVRNILTA